MESKILELFLGVKLLWMLLNQILIFNFVVGQAPS
jgi:hypothetical protein